MISIKERLVKMALQAIAYLPFSLAQGIGMTMGWLLWYFSSSTKFVIQKNIDLCFPDLSNRAKRRLGHRNMMESVCMLMEIPAFWFWPIDCLEGLIKEVRGLEYLQAAIAKGQGGILAVPHLGAWEAAQAYFVGRHKGIAMYRPPKMQGLDAFLRQARHRHSEHQYVPATAKGVKQILLAIKQGGLAFMLPDQVPKQNEILAPFCGVPAQTMQFPFKLLQKTQATLILLGIKRLGVGKGFCLEFYEAPAAVSDPDLTVAATALNSVITQMIYKNPAQYLWSYKRFKHAGPDGMDYYRP